jgi:hypothetical protein
MSMTTQQDLCNEVKQLKYGRIWGLLHSSKEGGFNIIFPRLSSFIPNWRNLTLFYVVEETLKINEPKILIEHIACMQTWDHWNLCSAKFLMRPKK